MNVYCRDQNEVKRVLDRIHETTYFSKLILKKIADNWKVSHPVITFDQYYISLTPFADTHDDGFMNADQYLRL
ncbi:MAG: hypothetical protein BWY67_01978 [Bacteroidetes bacterium ADurb.Bin397]|nr:MAG: hypothetical protein BWY67_01978 [Bacteroidetes bacterium ADurb.Bin397]